MFGVCRPNGIQEFLVLLNFFLCNFTITQLKNLHHFSNLRINFRFNVICHRCSMAARIFCRRLAERDVTVTLSVMCMGWLCWWYNHAAHAVSSSTSVAFPTSMSEKCKYTSSSAIKVKNQQKTVGTEEKLDVISWLDKDELAYLNVKTRS